MKRLISIALSLILSITLFACSDTAEREPSVFPSPTATPTLVSTATPEPMPAESEPADTQTVVTFKPCFAFDVIAALTYRGIGNFRDIDGQIEKHFEGMPKIGFADWYIHCLLRDHSYEEVENMDLHTLAEVFPDCLTTYDLAYWMNSEAGLAATKERITEGLKILEAMDFTSLWEKQCLPFLTRQCEAADTVLNEDPTAEGVLSDIKRLKSGKKLDNVTAYVLYFVNGSHWQITENMYLTNFHGEQITSAPLLQLFAHELIHSFSGDELQELYRKAAESDSFLEKSRDVLFNRKSSKSDEEEFVVALDHFVSFKNGLLTEQEAYDGVAFHYEGCMPVAVIVLDELMKLGDIPNDVDTWICRLFTDGVIKAGEIESRVESIYPGFVENFMERWG